MELPQQLTQFIADIDSLRDFFSLKNTHQCRTEAASNLDLCHQKYPDFLQRRIITVRDDQPIGVTIEKVISTFMRVFIRQVESGDLFYEVICGGALE